MRKNIHRLAGCTHDPLLHYLKALGVLRLVASQADESARGYWSQDNIFHLKTQLDEETLLQFFLQSYEPTPFVAPWNGGSGFYGKKAQDYLERIEQSDVQRLEQYRQTIAVCKQLLKELNLTEKPNKELKEKLLTLCRSRLPDSAVEVLDALYILTSDTSGAGHKSVPRFAPVLGSGGNDGNLEFTYTFFKHLQSAFPVKLDQWKEEQFNLSRKQLHKALFAKGNPPLVKDAIGQYHPGGIGGPNSIRGFEGKSLVNPWDYVLAFEGIILFAGAASRRFSETGSTAASFPFSVAVSAAGWGTLNTTEADSKARGELWLPLWQQPASYSEISYLFSEGRARVGRRQAKNGVDFSRAVAGLGIDRGINSFHRIGFLSGDRHGTAHLASSLGTFAVVPRPQVNLLDELDWWLDRYRRFCAEGSLTHRRILRSIEEAMFNFCRHGNPKRLQAVLVALGQASQLIAKSIKDDSPSPLTISSRWLRAVDDGTPEFRIAAAVASIAGDKEGKIGWLRENIEPVSWEKSRYQWKQSKENVPVTALPRTLAAVLERRMLAADKHNLEALPLQGVIKVCPADVQLYLDGRLDEARLLLLLQGLVLLNWSRANLPSIPEIGEEQVIDRSYAVLKLLFLPHGLRWPPGSAAVSIRPEKNILSRLRSGDLDGAVAIAMRRLRSSGFMPTHPDVNRLIARHTLMVRLAGALLIPVNNTNILSRLVLSEKMKGAEEA